MKNIMSTIGRFLLGIFEFIVIVYVVCITSFLLCRNSFGTTQIGKYSFIPVVEETEKFVKDGKAGDLLIVKSTADIEVKDFVYYYLAFHDEYVIRSGYVESIIEGDTNAVYSLNDADGASVSSKRMIGKYSSVIPGMGIIFSILVSRLGFLFLVLLPIMIIFIYQIYQFVMVLKYEKVELDSK